MSNNCSIIIDFSLYGLWTENHLRSQLTPTPYKIKVNNSKLIYFVRRIEITWTILMPRLSNFLRNSTIHFCRFLYFVTFFLRVTVSLLCRLQAVSKIHVPIYPFQISEGRRNCSTLWPAQQRNRDSRETCYQYKNMRKRMVNFFRKFENRGIKIARFNSLLISKSIDLQSLLLILYGVGSVVMLTSLN